MSEKRKSVYHGSSAAQRKAVAKYKAEKVEEIRVSVPKGHKSIYKDAAAVRGLSLNQFAIDAMDEKIARSSLSDDPGSGRGVNQ